MRKHWAALTAFAILVTAYAVLNVVIPTNAETLTRYNLTADSARMLRLSLAIPLIIIWTLVMYGYLRFKNYARSIEHGPDGKALSRVADGILALSLWLPLNSIISTAATAFYHRYPHFTEEAVIFRNHISLILLLIVIYILWRGSERLLTAVHIRLTTAQEDKLNILALIVILVFAYLTLFNPSRDIAPRPGTVALYYLPKEVLLFTIVIPYAFVWYFGIRAVSNVRIYARQVKGILYRNALGYLAWGLAFSVGSLLLLRYLSSFAEWLNSLALKPLLILLYVLVLAIGVSSVLLAIGAKKLQKIEEV